MISPPTGGYVLAGGQSSRMGQNKQSLPWHGMQLVEYVASQVKEAAGSVATVGGDPVPGVRYVPDPWVGFGPLGGIRAALENSAAEWNLVVACDMPLITPAFLKRLLADAAGDAVVPMTADGRLHPLCAAWSRTALPVVADAVDRGAHKVIDTLARLRHTVLDAGDGTELRNVNTPAEWASLTAGRQE